jgi:hypothetical protein
MRRALILLGATREGTEPRRTVSGWRSFLAGLMDATRFGVVEMAR